MALLTAASVVFSMDFLRLSSGEVEATAIGIPESCSEEVGVVVDPSGVDLPGAGGVGSGSATDSLERRSWMLGKGMGLVNGISWGKRAAAKIA